jgi:hypothetical protein
MRKVAIGVLALSLLVPVPAHSASVKYKNQKAGQFCAKKDKNKTVKLPDQMVLVCKADGTRHRWKTKTNG